MQGTLPIDSLNWEGPTEREYEKFIHPLSRCVRVFIYFTLRVKLITEKTPSIGDSPHTTVTLLLLSDEYPHYSIPLQRDMLFFFFLLVPQLSKYWILLYRKECSTTCYN